LRTSARTRATLRLLTHRNIGILTAHQEPLRLRSVQPVMHSLIAAPLHLLLATLNIGLISPLRPVGSHLLQQSLRALRPQPVEHGTRLLVLLQFRLI
tara:strand:+ start:1011 stop:1301 length:291 start_codon:yes stop_codon:yes gene_type:complete